MDNFKKILGITVGLTGAGHGVGQGAEIKNIEKTKTELTAEKTNPELSEGNYDANRDFYKNTNAEESKLDVSFSDDKIQIQMFGCFVKDSPVITEKAKKDIHSQFKEFLNQITSKNYKQILEKGITIYAYSDSMLVKRFEDPEIPSLVRGGKVKDELIKTINETEFKHLTPDEIVAFKKTGIYVKLLPPSNRVEHGKSGVRYPEDSYTNTQIAVMSEEQLRKVTEEECNGFIIDIPLNFGNSLEKESKVIKFDGDQIIFDVDNESLGITKRVISKVTEDKSLESKKVLLSSFSDKDVVVCKNLNDLIKKIGSKVHEGYSSNKILDLTLEKIKSINNNKQELINYVSFTESLGLLSSLETLTQLEELLKSKNINYVILVGDENNLRVITLDDIRALLEKQRFNDVKKEVIDFLNSMCEQYSISTTNSTTNSYNLSQKKIFNELLNTVKSYQDFNQLLNNDKVMTICKNHNIDLFRDRKISFKNLGTRVSFQKKN